MNISYSLLDPGLYICTFLYLCGCEVLSKCTCLQSYNHENCAGLRSRPRCLVGQVGGGGGGGGGGLV